jgi:hypothetical protein
MKIDNFSGFSVIRFDNPTFRDGKKAMTRYGSGARSPLLPKALWGSNNFETYSKTGP